MHNTDYITPETAKTLAGLFKERVQRSPHDIAYRVFDAQAQQWQDIAWSTMAAKVARCQAALQQESLQAGDRIALLLPNGSAWVEFDQAALGLGLVVVPLYTNDRPENVGYILQHAEVKLLVMEGQQDWPEYKKVLAELPDLLRIVSLQGAEDPQEPRLRTAQQWYPPGTHPLQTVDTDPDRLATIVYTSGTTGRSKGVMLSHRNILSNAYAGLQCVSAFKDDIFLSFLPLSHTLERTVGYYLTMMCGTTVAYARSIADLPEDLRTIRPTCLISVPRIYERIYNKIQAGLEQRSAPLRFLFCLTVQIGWHRFLHQQGRAPWRPSQLLYPFLHALIGRKFMQQLGGRVRISLCGGAPLSPVIAKTFIGLGLQLGQGYGLTETSPIISVFRPDNNEPYSVGLPVPGVETRIGKDDELQVKGPNIMLGYWKNPKATQKILGEDGWLHTGDKARIENGHIHITGRIKEIIVLANGEKIAPTDMEMAIAQDPLFEQAMVVGEGMPFLSAIVVLNRERWKTTAGTLDPDAMDDKSLQVKVLHRIGYRLRAFPGYAQIHQVCLQLDPWTVENELVTPTLKLRRNQILHYFNHQVKLLYQGH